MEACLRAEDDNDEGRTGPTARQLGTGRPPGHICGRVQTTGTSPSPSPCGRGRGDHLPVPAWIDDGERFFRATQH
jgi:hypothetical protein